MNDEPQRLTRLLELAADGDTTAAEHVFPAVYDELRRLASAQRARMPAGDTFCTTALVNEAYLRLVGRDGASYAGRHHFFCTAARSMRDILVDEARKRSSLKRGGDLQRIELNETVLSVPVDAEELLELDMVLRKLEKSYPTEHEIVMLRYFAGLTIPEVAEVLDVSLRTAERRWRFCRSWLARELGTTGDE